jgi:hypothetical protein
MADLEARIAHAATLPPALVAALYDAQYDEVETRVRLFADGLREMLDIHDSWSDDLVHMVDTAAAANRNHRQEKLLAQMVHQKQQQQSSASGVGGGRHFADERRGAKVPALDCDNFAAQNNNIHVAHLAAADDLDDKLQHSIVACSVTFSDMSDAMRASPVGLSTEVRDVLEAATAEGDMQMEHGMFAAAERAYRKALEIALHPKNAEAVEPIERIELLVNWAGSHCQHADDIVSGKYKPSASNEYESDRQRETVTANVAKYHRACAAQGYHEASLLLVQVPGATGATASAISEAVLGHLGHVANRLNEHDAALVILREAERLAKFRDYSGGLEPATAVELDTARKAVAANDKERTGVANESLKLRCWALSMTPVANLDQAKQLIAQAQSVLADDDAKQSYSVASRKLREAALGAVEADIFGAIQWLESAAKAQPKVHNMTLAAAIFTAARLFHALSIIALTSAAAEAVPSALAVTDGAADADSSATPRSRKYAKAPTEKGETLSAARREYAEFSYALCCRAFDVMRTVSALDVPDTTSLSTFSEEMAEIEAEIEYVSAYAVFHSDEFAVAVELFDRVMETSTKSDTAKSERRFLEARDRRADSVRRAERALMECYLFLVSDKALVSAAAAFEGGFVVLSEPTSLPMYRNKHKKPPTSAIVAVNHSGPTADPLTPPSPALSSATSPAKAAKGGVKFADDVTPSPRGNHNRHADDDGTNTRNAVPISSRRKTIVDDLDLSFAVGSVPPDGAGVFGSTSPAMNNRRRSTIAARRRRSSAWGGSFSLAASGDNYDDGTMRRRSTLFSPQASSASESFEISSRQTTTATDFTLASTNSGGSAARRRRSRFCSIFTLSVRRDAAEGDDDDDDIEFCIDGPTSPQKRKKSRAAAAYNSNGEEEASHAANVSMEKRQDTDEEARFQRMCGQVDGDGDDVNDDDDDELGFCGSKNYGTSSEGVAGAATMSGQDALLKSWLIPGVLPKTASGGGLDDTAATIPSAGATLTPEMSSAPAPDRQPSEVMPTISASSFDVAKRRLSRAAALREPTAATDAAGTGIGAAASLSTAANDVPTNTAASLSTTTTTVTATADVPPVAPWRRPATPGGSDADDDDSRRQMSFSRYSASGISQSIFIGEPGEL